MGTYKSNEKKLEEGNLEYLFYFTGRSEDESGGSFSDDIPEFVSSNSTQEVSQGDTVALSCQVNKLASFAIIWSV